MSKKIKCAALENGHVDGTCKRSLIRDTCCQNVDSFINTGLKQILSKSAICFYLQGVVRLHIVAARELKKADFKVMGKGKSDPYCKIYSEFIKLQREKQLNHYLLCKRSCETFYVSIEGSELLFKFYVKQCNHFIVLIVGAKTFKTKVIENTIAPTWNAYFEVCHVYSFSSKWNARNGDIVML